MCHTAIPSKYTTQQLQLTLFQLNVVFILVPLLLTGRMYVARVVSLKELVVEERVKASRFNRREIGELEHRSIQPSNMRLFCLQFRLCMGLCIFHVKNNNDCIRIGWNVCLLRV